MSGRWPSSPLAAARRAFRLLCCPPAPLALDCRAFPGLPDRLVPLDELATLLMGDPESPSVCDDLVWRDLVIRARRDGPAWVVAAAGLAMPGLRAVAGRVAWGWRGETSDLDAEVLAGFVGRLKTVDLDAPRICGRLVDAGLRAGRKARAAEKSAGAVHGDLAYSRPPEEPWDHPDWVLARAVAAAVIDPDECLLIGATRLEDVPLRVAADKLGIGVALAAAWRRQGERRLARAIADGELDWVSLNAGRPRA